MKNTFIFWLIGLALSALSCNEANTSEGEQPEKDPVTEESIQVMAFNIHHANPPSKPNDFIDLDAVVQVIREQAPDLVALQEVDVLTKRSGNVNQAKEIAGQLGMHYFFGKAIDYQGGEYGVAILSKYPLSDSRVDRLPTKEGTNGEPRILASAKVLLPNGKSIRFGSTHLDAQSNATNRILQVKELNRIASEETLPLVIAGDLNATPEKEEIQLLDATYTRTCQDCPATYPASGGTKVIDYIAFDPAGQFETLEHKVVEERYASDHLPVMASLRLLAD
ncbi:endonuclease/exonuclease/phosphatase family protein [Rapidithrix thailandica]|uniref:Endonuclease/exonuclease/phosphatase family protein n=1 Tax=Rapidithrix thailandica TaxID=413964 RepID=A0AAW9S6F6_9BACT